MALTDETHVAETAERDERTSSESPRKPTEDRPEPRESAHHEPSGLQGSLGTLRRHPVIAGFAALIIIAAIVAGAIWWLNARHYESTDDAFIDARTVPISADVAGRIVAVPVTDNQRVAAGAVLVRIDPRDYRVAVEQARAQLQQADANVANLAAQIDAQQAKIAQAQKEVTQARAASQFAEQQNRRYQNLLESGSGTEQRAQQAASEFTQQQAALAGAQANETGAEKQLTVLRTRRQSAQAQVKAAQATLDQAQTNLARTTIEAPRAGRIAKLSAAKGAYAQPGSALMELVPGNFWITANFKETQLTDMRPGQPVDIAVDAYPGKTFHGHVDSIQAGSGTAFSLLPPENATGNFVKVVQRVPVKIVFDTQPDVYLGPGMSVVPSVKVR
jgi:membrane fusion protein (multidrug efflux system)